MLLVNLRGSFWKKESFRLNVSGQAETFFSDSFVKTVMNVYDPSEIISICDLILEDGELSGEELYGLAEWLNNHRDACFHWPGNLLVEPLQSVWADGKITKTELRAISRILLQIRKEWAKRLAQGGEPEASSWCGTGARECRIEPGSETGFRAYIWATNKWEGRFGVRYSRASIWGKVPYQVKRYLPIFNEKEWAIAWTDPIIFEPTQKDIAAALEREAKWSEEESEVEPAAGFE